MSDVEFLGETNLGGGPGGFSRPPRDTNTPLIKLVIKSGLAKDRQGANVVLVGVLIFCILAMGFFIYKVISVNKVSPVPTTSKTR